MNLDYYANGNIKTTRWKTTYHAPNVYSYKYDKLNRLEDALYNPSSAGPGVGAQDIFSVSGITYDGIGNIMPLNRQGVTPCGGPGGAELVVNAIDQLAYSYANGSRLSEVVDNATHLDLKDLGVKNGGGTYQYDAAGRMTHDNHRGLVIEYNHLDLPRRITDQNNVVTDITYDATGRKWLQQTTTDARIYAGSVVLTKENGTYSLEAANTSDGRLVYDAEVVEVYPEFYHKDHLGNVRVAFADRNKDLKIELLGPTSEITQQNDYYPFGLRQEGDSLVFHQELSSSRYRYNGIEHNEELGLDMAFYRSYDPAIGRWLQIDPRAEKYVGMSPYNGMGNNPILYNDPMGDTINLSLFQQVDQKLGTNYTQQITDQLSTITGLNISVNESGQLSYAKDSDGGAIVSESGGSSSARNDLISAMDMETTVNVTMRKGRGSATPNGGTTIGLDPDQIDSFVAGTEGVNKNTQGIGMTLLHEFGHTGPGGSLTDPPETDRTNTGPVVDRINIYRTELNANPNINGQPYGQRSHYNAIDRGKYKSVRFRYQAVIKGKLKNRSGYVRYQ